MQKSSILVLILLHSLVSVAQKPIKRGVVVPKGKIVVQSYPFVLKDDPNPVRYFNFKKDTIMYKPTYYYIKGIIDSTFKDSIGYVVQPKSGKKQKANFKGGLQTALLDFINASVQKDTTLTPIEISIKQFDLSEEKNDMYAQGLFNYRYSFNYKEGIKYIYLNEAKGNYSYTQPLPLPNKRTDSMFSTVFTSHLTDLDTIIKEMLNEHTYFCKGVDVTTFSKEENTKESDTLFSTKDNQVDIDDFLGDASGADEYFKNYISLYVRPSFDYNNGKVKVNVQTGAFLLKPECWVGSKLKKTTIVNNANYKLKLAWLESERLRKKIIAYKFSCLKYLDELKDLINFSVKQMQYVFNEYEKQTLNGANKTEQQRWQKFIENQIAELENKK